MTILEVILLLLLIAILGLMIYAVFFQKEEERESTDFTKEIVLPVIREVNELKTVLNTEKLMNPLLREFGNLKEGLVSNQNQNGKNLTQDISEFERKITQMIQVKLDKINEKVDDKLKEGFDKTNQTFQNVLERLGKIDEAQKNIEKLSTDVVSLQDVLAGKKTRGIFGEVQLSHILSNIFGDNNGKVFALQHKMQSTRDIVDAMLFAPEPLGNISIDSKFPLENYRKMVDIKLPKFEREQSKKLFKNDIKKHIDAIAGKYIIAGETSDQAIMFIPAESIFAEINAYHQDLVNYAQKKRIWLTSPSTLMSSLTTIQIIMQNIERDKNAKIIQEELMKLSVEFGRYRQRWENLSKKIKGVTKDVDLLNTTSSKIDKKFEAISKVQIETEPGTDKIQTTITN